MAEPFREIELSGEGDRPDAPLPAVTCAWTRFRGRELTAAGRGGLWGLA